MVARFVGAQGPRLLAQVAAPAGPADSVWARWVVQDTSGRAVAQGAGAFATSGCDPTALRVADLSADLVPGDYMVIFSARDARHRRGLYRAPAHLEPPPAGIMLSDLVLTCGSGGALAQPGAIRLDANLEHVVGPGEPLAAYFELYGLTPDASGVSRFQYEYRIAALNAPRNWLERTFGFTGAPTVVTVTREEMQQSALRRQFLNLPVQTLAPGRYRLEVRVRDQVAGKSVTGLAEFTKFAANAAQTRGEEP
jgi:hypothetical protein